MPELPAGSGDIANTPPTVPPAAPAEPSAPAPAEATPAQPAETAPAQPAEAAPAVPAPAEPAPAQPAEAAPAQPAQPAAAEPAQTTHVVAGGDTYWDLAAKAYGDGTKWRTIAEANPGYRPRRLPIGATLTIPAAQ